MAIDATNVLARDTLVIKQKAKVFELRNQFQVLDEAGQPVGAVEQINRSALATLTRIVSDLDVLLPMTLAFTDTTGQTVMTMHKPWSRWACDVTLGAGQPMGRITKEVRIGK